MPGWANWHVCAHWLYRMPGLGNRMPGWTNWHVCARWLYHMPGWANWYVCTRWLYSMPGWAYWHVCARWLYGMTGWANWHVCARWLYRMLMKCIFITFYLSALICVCMWFILSWCAGGMLIQFAENTQRHLCYVTFCTLPNVEPPLRSVPCHAYQDTFIHMFMANKDDNKDVLNAFKCFILTTSLCLLTT